MNKHIYTSFKNLYVEIVVILDKNINIQTLTFAGYYIKCIEVAFNF